MAPLLLLLLPALAVAKDRNAIVRNPTVRCGVDGVIFEMETLMPFTGQLYVKNEYKRGECRANFGGETKNASGGVFRLHFNECGMRRQRMINPKGMAYTTTMVVQFHETFVTESDKAYQIRCFYREHNLGINAEQMNISPLTTILMEVSHPVPKCAYSIRHKSMDGPPASYVTVGDPVVHLFKCDTDDSMYRMLIRDCYVDDGKENKQQIIDEEGCSVDADIVETPEYTETQLVVFAEATVFKWPDEAAVYFSCQLTLCTTEDPDCILLTPPKCGSRRRRAVGRGIFPVAREEAREAAREAARKAAETRADRLHLDLEVRRLVVLDLDPLHESGLDSRKLHFSVKSPMNEKKAEKLIETPETSTTTEDGSTEDGVEYTYTTQATTSPTTDRVPPLLQARTLADIPMVADLVIRHGPEEDVFPPLSNSRPLLNVTTPPSSSERLQLLHRSTTPPPSTTPLPSSSTPHFTTLSPEEFQRRVEEEVRRRIQKTRRDDILTQVAELAWSDLKRVVPESVAHSRRLGIKERGVDRDERLQDSPIFKAQCYSPQLVLCLGVVIAVLGVGLAVAAGRLLWPALARASYSTHRPSSQSFAPYYASSIISSSCHEP